MTAGPKHGRPAEGFPEDVGFRQAAAGGGEPTGHVEAPPLPVAVAGGGGQAGADTGDPLVAPGVPEPGPAEELDGPGGDGPAVLGARAPAVCVVGPGEQSAAARFQRGRSRLAHVTGWGQPTGRRSSDRTGYGPPTREYSTHREADGHSQTTVGVPTPTDAQMGRSADSRAQLAPCDRAFAAVAAPIGPEYSRPSTCSVPGVDHQCQVHTVAKTAMTTAKGIGHRASRRTRLRVSMDRPYHGPICRGRVTKWSFLAAHQRFAVLGVSVSPSRFR